MVWVWIWAWIWHGFSIWHGFGMDLCMVLDGIGLILLDFCLVLAWVWLRFGMVVAMVLGFTNGLTMVLAWFMASLNNSTKKINLRYMKLQLLLLICIF